MTQKTRYVRTKKASEILGISTSTLYRMIEQGVFTPSKTLGGQRRFDVEELLLFQKNSQLIKAPQNPSQEKLEPINTEPKPVDKRNMLNDLNGTQWLPLTKSFFYQKGLGAKHPEAQIERLHPAPYSYQDIAQLVSFFTKEGMNVLDPFGGVGSTAKACAIEKRTCTSIELQKQWHDLAIERLNTEVELNEAVNHHFYNGDSIKVLPKLDTSSFDFIVTSPPYWSILNKKADHKVKSERIAHDLATKYSDNDQSDLGNIEDYQEFISILVNKVFLECFRVLKPKKYMCIVVSDFRHKSDFISFHSDLIQAINNMKTVDGYEVKLQGVKTLLQNHKSLMPYGYPFAYVENIHHQYVLIFRKM